LVVVWALALPVAAGVTLGVRSSADRVGTATGTATTRGDFRPGGRVRVALRTKARSVEGFYRAVVSVRPRLPETAGSGFATASDWSARTLEPRLGYPWGDIITREGAIAEHPTVVTFAIDVPPAAVLAGAEIALDVTATVIYPHLTAEETFEDRETQVVAEVPVILDPAANRELPLQKRFEEEPIGQGHLMVLSLWLVGFLPLALIARRAS
jgi:hypothetical protein